MPSPSLETKNVYKPLVDKYQLHRLPKNRALLYQGEVPNVVFYIKSGIVKIYNITTQGEEKTVGYEDTGGFLPVEWLFKRTPASLYYYDTFTDCEIVRIPRDDVRDFFRQNHSAALAILDRSVSMYTGAIVHVHALEQSKARDKLLYLFQFLVLRFGKPIDKTHTTIDLRLTHQEIANLIGTTRETVSNEISKLTKEGVMHIQDHRHAINTDKALRLLGENDFNQLSLQSQPIL